MTRIFLSLSGFSIALLCANILLGLAIGDYNGEFARVQRQGQPILAEVQRLREERPRPLAEIDARRAEFDRHHLDDCVAPGRQPFF